MSVWPSTVQKPNGGSTTLWDHESACLVHGQFLLSAAAAAAGLRHRLFSCSRLRSSSIIDVSLVLRFDEAISRKHRVRRPTSDVLAEYSFVSPRRRRIPSDADVTVRQLFPVCYMCRRPRRIFLLTEDDRATILVQLHEANGPSRRSVLQCVPVSAPLYASNQSVCCGRV
jgi:hypothetical protein